MMGASVFSAILSSSDSRNDFHLSRVQTSPKKHLQIATVPAGGASQVHFRFGSAGPLPTNLMQIRVPFGCVARRDSSRERAAALDCAERTGKFPGFTVPPLALLRR